LHIRENNLKRQLLSDTKGKKQLKMILEKAVMLKKEKLLYSILWRRLLTELTYDVPSR